MTLTMTLHSVWKSVGDTKWSQNWGLTSVNRCVTPRDPGITWVTDSDGEVIQLLLFSLQGTQCLNSSRNSINGEGFRRGVWILGREGVSQLSVQRPFFICIVDQQLSHQAAWKQNQRAHTLRRDLNVFRVNPVVAQNVQNTNLHESEDLYSMRVNI